MAENPLQPREPEPEVVEPEIVGLEPRPSLWRRLASRFVLCAATAALGLALIAAGVLLTLTIVGAMIGIPMILLGLGAIFLAVLLFFGGGNVKFRVGGFPR